MSVVRTLISLLEIAGTFPVWGVVLLSRVIGDELHVRVFCTMSQALSILPGDPGNIVRLQCGRRGIGSGRYLGAVGVRGGNAGLTRGLTVSATSGAKAMMANRREQMISSDFM